MIWVEFDWETDIYRARQIATEKLTGISGRLPEGVGIPTLGAQSSLLAEVMIGAKSPKLGMASERGKPAVLLSVNKQPHTNTVELTERLDQAVEEIQKSLPGAVRLSTNIFRQASFIENAIRNVEKAILEGALFLVVILFLFLNNWKSVVISLLALPLSLFMAILTLNWFGFTLNTMSLGGMAIAIGAMVDDAIIDVENVYRRIRENFRKPADQRTGILEVVYKGSTEIRSSIFNATLIIIVTFVPLFFLSGMEGRMLKPLGISFIVSLFSSMLVAITVTPVLCSFWLTDERTARKADRDAWIVRFLKRSYEVGLVSVLQNRWIIVSSGVILLALALIFLFSFGRSFLPSFNEGSMTIMANTQPGISLEESDKLAQLVENTLM